MATQADLDIIYEWQKNFWKFAEDCFKMSHAQPIDSLRGKPITYTDHNGRKHTTLLFDSEGYPVYHDLKFYKRKHFKNQLPHQFKEHCKGQFTWQQTLTLTAYQRGLNTFGKDAYNISDRFITVTSGHGCFALGTLVRMMDGTTKKVEDIVVGDKVMGDDSTPRTVQELYRGVEEMYRIVYNWGDYYEVNKSHKLVLCATTDDLTGCSGDIWEESVGDFLSRPIRDRMGARIMKWGKDYPDQPRFEFHTLAQGKGDYYGFELDGNHRFLHADGSVLRNSGKTCSLAVISLHFLISYFGAQIGATANTEAQLKDIFLKEFYYWKKKMPKGLADEITQLDDHVRVGEDKDWFLRASVGRKETPEALAGLHGEHVLLLADEASAIHDKVFEVMKGALTGNNYMVIYTSNPTRGTGEFYDSHKKGSPFTRLAFNSEDSPIVEDGFIDMMKQSYGADSEEYRIRVLGKFPDTAQMDEKGWIPLFANVTINYEPERNQIIKFPVIALDPAGNGRDSSSAMARDTLYLREILNEAKSTPIDLAGKLRTLVEAYGVTMDDVGVDAFGVGAEVVANLDAGVHALLTDHPREQNKLTTHDNPNDGTTLRFNSWKSELAWKFMLWLKQGGIIITNNPNKWKRQLEKIKYRRDTRGRIQLMPKTEFKKEYGFSPDEFDASIYTLFKDVGTMPTILTKEQIADKELQGWIQRQNSRTQAENAPRQHSSM